MGLKKSSLVSIAALAAIVIGVPVGILTVQAHRKGLGLGQFVRRSFGRLSPEKGRIAAETGPAAAGQTGISLSRRRSERPGRTGPGSRTCAPSTSTRTA